MAVINIVDKGASPTFPDNTAIIQAAIDGLSVGDTLWVPPVGSFNINATGIRPKSGTTIQLEGTLQQITKPNEDWHRIIMLDNGVTNVTIQGHGTLRGCRDTHVGNETDSGATGHNVDVRESCSNILLYGFTTANAWGDGVCFCQDNGSQSSGGPPKKVTIKGLTFDFNRRNGLSVISGDTVNVTGCTFNRTGQPPRNTPPYFGIDLECGMASQSCANITISGNRFIDNFDTNIGVGSPIGTYRNISIFNNVYDWRQQPIATTGTAGKLNAPAWAIIGKALFGWRSDYRYWGFPGEWRI